MALLSKPGTALEWCNNNPVDGTSGQTAIIDPSGGKKDSGFIRLEKPPRQDFNWFMNNSGLWTQYLETLTDAAPFVNAINYNLDVGNTGAQNTTALIAAFAASPNVFVPAGDYDFAGNITFPEGANLIGVPSQLNGTNFNFTAAASWDVLNKRTTIKNIVFLCTPLLSLTILAGHDDDKGMTLIEKCTFSGNSTGAFYFIDLESGISDDLGLVHLVDCTAFNTNMFKNTSAVNFCPRMRVSGGIFFVSNFDFTSDSTSVRVFDNNTMTGSTYDISGSGTVFEENKFIGSAVFTFTGTDSCIVRNNVDDSGAISVVADATSRAFFSNNKGLDGLISDETETIRGVRYYGENTGTLVADTTTVKINFNTNRTVSMARISTYAKNIVEDGTGTFTIIGISPEQTRIQCTIGYSAVAPTGNFQAFLKINGTNAYMFDKSLANANNSVLSLNQTIQFSQGDTFTIEVENFTGGNITNVLSLNSIPAHIVVDGF